MQTNVITDFIVLPLKMKNNYKRFIDKKFNRSILKKESYLSMEIVSGA
jgi:hypothetical protein